MARGIAAVMVVFYHTIVPQMRRDSIFLYHLFDFLNFHVVIFAMISGYLFERNLSKYRAGGFGRFTLQKFQALMVPYFSFSAITYLGIAVAMLVPSLARILQSAGYDSVGFLPALWQILTHENHMDRHLWFVYALFLAFLVSFLFTTVLQRPVGVLITAIVYILASYISIPFIIQRMLYLLFFFTIARQLAFIDWLIQKTSRTVLITILFIGLTALQQSGAVSHILALDILVSMLARVGGALVVMAIAQWLPDTRIGALIGKISNDSFFIYLMHQPFIVSGTSAVLLSKTTLPFGAIMLITLCLGIAIPVAAKHMVIDRVRWMRCILLGDFSTQAASK